MLCYFYNLENDAVFKIPNMFYLIKVKYNPLFSSNMLESQLMFWCRDTDF